MSGHSKWATTKHRKGAQDAKRSALFSKLSRNITVAARLGGDPLPENNASLAAAVAKAKAQSMPKDKIKSAIDKAFGSGADAAVYENIVYEGYGPAGVAVYVDCLTDNRNRTAADLRHYFDKNGGNLGAMGCVGFLFTEKGVIVLDGEGLDEEKVMEDCFDAGADDFDMGDDVVEVTCSPDSFSDVRQKLEEKGYTFISAEVEMVPSTTTPITDPDAQAQMAKLLDALDDDDDVQNVWHNLENEEDLDR